MNKGTIAFMSISSSANDRKRTAVTGVKETGITTTKFPSLFRGLRLCAGNETTRGTVALDRVGAGLYSRPLAIIAAWYFTTTVLLGYFFNPGPGNPSPDWTVYYRVVYMPVMAALSVAAIIGVTNLQLFNRLILYCFLVVRHR